MSFKSVILYWKEPDYRWQSPSQKALSSLVSSCPVIENLSLIFKRTTDTDQKFYLGVDTLLGLACITTIHLEDRILRKSDPDDSRDDSDDSRDDPDDSRDNDSTHQSHLPLKSMSLKAVDLESFSELISSCPSIECLSFSSCSIPRDIQFSSSSLKTLEVIDCKGQQLNVYEATNLESFTCLISEIDSEIEQLPRLGSEIGQLTRTALHGCENLKHVNIFSEHLEHITLGGCKDCVEATIDTPNLKYFHFIGNLKSTISMEAPNLFDANITLLCGKSTPFPTVGTFLKKFGHSKRILLNIDDAEVDFIIPQSSRESFSCLLLPSLKFLVVYRKEKFKERDSDLQNFMLWMGPSACKP